jgi:hypothetical protein
MSAQDGIIDRFLRMHSYEVIIFFMMILLLGLCMTAAPLLSKDIPN